MDIPQINLATRITDTTMTLIDNIFTNTMNYNSFSGNILIQIADHLSQFSQETWYLQKRL